MPVDPAAPIAAGYSAGQWGVLLGLLVVGLGLHVLLVLWLRREVIACGRHARTWTIAAALLLVPTLIAWAFVRPPAPRPVRAVRETPPPAVEDPDPFRLGVRPEATMPRPEDVRGALAAGGAPGIEVACPRCATRFATPRAAEGPTRVTCPACGASGHVA